MVNRLKKIYSQLKTVYQLQEELEMWKRKSILSYATRIKETTNKIFDAHRINNGGELEDTFQAGLKKKEIRIKEGDVFRDVTNNPIEVELTYK